MSVLQVALWLLTQFYPKTPCFTWRICFVWDIIAWPNFYRSSCKCYSTNKTTALKHNSFTAPAELIKTHRNTHKNVPWKHRSASGIFTTTTTSCYHFKGIVRRGEDCGRKWWERRKVWEEGWAANVWTEAIGSHLVLMCLCMQSVREREREYSSVLKLSVVKMFPCVLMFPLKTQQSQEKIKLRHGVHEGPSWYQIASFPVKPLCLSLSLSLYGTFLASK